MKKYLLLLLVLLVSLPFSSQAQQAMTVTINQEAKKVYPVNIVLDEEAVETETPPFVLVDRTFVPVRMVAEKFGAQVDWDQDTYSVTITRGSDVIKLSIDDKAVIVNGEQQTLHDRAVPRLAVFDGQISKTMVPVRFVSETLNYEVDWEQSTRTVSIKNVQTASPLEEDTVEEMEETVSELSLTLSNQRGSGGLDYMVVQSSSEMNPSMSWNNNALTVDFQQKINVNGSMVHPQLENTETKETSIVLHMNNNRPFSQLSEDKKTLTIGYPTNFKHPQVTTHSGLNALRFSGYQGKGYKVQTLKNPERVIVDLHDATLVGGEYETSLSGGSMKNVKVVNRGNSPVFKDYESTIRLIFYGRDGVLDPQMDILELGTELYFVPKRTLLDYVTINPSSNGQAMAIDGVPAGGQIKSYDDKSKTLTISVPRIQDPDLYGVLYPENPLIREVFIDQHVRDEVIVKFRKIVDFQLMNHSGNLGLNVWRKTNIAPSEITIYIDAGHGGNDPGAVARDGFQEKEVNLDVTNLVIDYLQYEGYNVEYTRREDVYVDYYDVARRANEQGADIFVSIHSNASPSNFEAHGIEVLYAPMSGLSHKFDKQEPLARALLDHMVETTGAHNRGLVQRPNVVVIRNTNMAAALVELGFLTNEEERELLKDEEYQELLAEGIVNGIKEFIKNDL